MPIRKTDRGTTRYSRPDDISNPVKDPYAVAQARIRNLREEMNQYNVTGKGRGFKTYQSVAELQTLLDDEDPYTHDIVNANIKILAEIYRNNTLLINKTIQPLVAHFDEDATSMSSTLTNFGRAMDQVQYYMELVHRKKAYDMQSLKEVMIALDKAIQLMDAQLEGRDLDKLQPTEFKKYQELRSKIDTANKGLFGLGYVKQGKTKRELEAGTHVPRTQEQAQATVQLAQVEQEANAVEVIEEAVIQTPKKGLSKRQQQYWVRKQSHESMQELGRRFGVPKKPTPINTTSYLPVPPEYQPFQDLYAMGRAYGSEAERLNQEREQRLREKEQREQERNIASFFIQMDEYCSEGVIPQWDLVAPDAPDVTQDELDALETQYEDLVKEMQKDEVKRELRDLQVSLLRVAQDFIKSVQNAIASTAQQMYSFGDMFANILSPIDTLVALIGGQVNAVTAQATMFQSVLVLAVSPFEALLGTDDEKDDKKKKKKKSGDMSADEKKAEFIGSIAKAFMSIVSITVNMIASCLSLIMNGVSMFTSQLSGMLNFLKKVFQTSKLLEEILNMVNLAITMFFMPFFMSFANPLLDTMFRILSWVLQMFPHDDSERLNAFTEVQETIIACLNSMGGTIRYIMEEGLSQLLPLLILAFADMMVFVLYFVETVLNNSAKVQQLLQTGIDVGNTLLQNNIIQLFLQVGTQCMEFIQNNAEQIYTLLKVAFKAQNAFLQFMAPALDHLFAFCVAQGAQLGQAIATIITLQFLDGGIIINLALQAVGVVGISEVITLIKAQAIGQLVGGAIGGILYAMFFSFQKGGYIPATPGGVLTRVAEKETEYLIPESKLHLIRGHNNLVLEINGDVYGVDNPENIITDAVNQQSVSARFR